MTLNPFLKSSVEAYGAEGKVAEIKALARQYKTSDESTLREVCEDFEALFVKMMLDSMRKTLNDNSLIPKNSGEKLFEDKLFDEYARKIGHIADFGVADMMYNQLIDGLPGSSLSLEI